MNPTVTVVIPAHNAAQYLSETIKSVLTQTFNNFELVIVDDGSIDNTAEVAHYYSQQDKRVKLISQINQGVSTARNTGIKIARGGFIALLDSDDQWLPINLTTHVEHLTSNSNLGISFGRVEFMNFNGRPTGQLSNSPLSNLKPENFLYENPTITCSNLVIRREVFEQAGYFDESMNYSEDLDWCLRVMCNSCWKIEGINKVLVRYRTTKEGLSSKLYQMEADWELFISKARQQAPELVAQHHSKLRASHLRYLARRASRLNLPSGVGVDFMTRALRSNWKVILRQPRSTILTMLAIYGQHLMGYLNLHSSLDQRLEK